MRTDNGMLTVMADRALDEVAHLEIVVVPGGLGTRALLEDERMLGWIRTAHQTSQYDPQPPFDAGSTDKAAPELVERIRSLAAALPQ